MPEKEDTEFTFCVPASDAALKIEAADNGKGMRPELVEHLSDRYYRGTSTDQKPERLFSLNFYSVTVNYGYLKVRKRLADYH
ncbi:hypothetical protein GPL15_20585 [Clostridium sp. MCC353]|uniref:ATP-binding protein n=1 Tax=Clostridium sp. MCC353 TaxID=2592646 RepID=UPI001C0193EC|nr:hypothetical protein [Clostridium sp. MCC353]